MASTRLPTLATLAACAISCAVHLHALLSDGDEQELYADVQASCPAAPDPDPDRG